MTAFGATVLACLTLLLLAALWLPPGSEGAAFALLVSLTPALVLLVVAGGRGRHGRARSWLDASVLVCAVCIGGGFWTLGALRHSDPLVGWLLGLPAVLGVMIWVLALAPLVLLGLLFGWGFPRWRPSSADVARLRALAASEDEWPESDWPESDRHGSDRNGAGPTEAGDG